MNWINRLRAWLASVVAVDVGKPDDGLASIMSSGTSVDPTWHDLSDLLENALEAWRKNPMARRIINLIVAYVIGPGIELSSDRQPLAKFVREFWAHRKNQIEYELVEWCAELSRSGELFLALFVNADDGMVYVRAIPASQIDQVDYDPNDYKNELRYHQKGDSDNLDGIWWDAIGKRDEVREGGRIQPVMLHYAVNRPVGAVRGESDLAPILPWLRRYNRWLEDRVRLNAGVRSWLWILKAPARMHAQLAEKYRRPPEAGSVIISDSSEEWSAVAPTLHAADAANDGRAIRWMISAGGPGTGLTDFGEAETANLATARSMGELRRRFLRQRQKYFGWMLADVAVQAYNYSVLSGVRRGATVSVADVIVRLPDISPEDNQALASAAKDMASALMDVAGLVGESEALRRRTVALVMKFAGESLPVEEVEELADGDRGVGAVRKPDGGPVQSVPTFYRWGVEAGGRTTAADPSELSVRSNNGTHRDS